MPCGYAMKFQVARVRHSTEGPSVRRNDLTRGGGGGCLRLLSSTNWKTQLSFKRSVGRSCVGGKNQRWRRGGSEEEKRRREGKGTVMSLPE